MSFQTAVLSYCINFSKLDHSQISAGSPTAPPGDPVQVVSGMVTGHLCIADRCIVQSG